MELLALNRELIPNNLEAWLAELGDTETPLDNEVLERTSVAVRRGHNDRLGRLHPERPGAIAERSSRRIEWMFAQEY
ncbi:unnamed protein product [Phytophthora fragariaefolia]|uniref:Unnamed protein product n=1 Tax=Phytophthora fragariaefolia TaxID=1490495 RepID=A0A9W6YAV3_9STRA|nr:unnamed protein product [Phytophthora fragariaefolia]